MAKDIKFVGNYKILDIVGKGGGFIMDAASGVVDEAKAKNVRAMADFTKEYGVY